MLQRSISFQHAPSGTTATREQVLGRRVEFDHHARPAFYWSRHQFDTSDLATTLSGGTRRRAMRIRLV